MISKQSILDKVYTKTYYIGESKKGKDPDMKYVQAGADDADILSDYLMDEINRMRGYMTKRLVDFVLKNDCIFLRTNRPDRRDMLPVIERSFESYLVEYLSWKWIKDNYPQIADPSDKDARLWELKDHITSLSPRVRRRATEMGI